MTLRQRISTLSQLGQRLTETGSVVLADIIQGAYLKNQWFTIENIKNSLNAICQEYLDEEKLTNWVESYDINDTPSGKTVGIVMAGNLPLVGFHDLICTYISGHKTMYKLSSKDDVLLPAIVDIMCDIEPLCRDFFIQVERLKGYDAVIATGGDTAAVHFEYYFRNYPHIIRKNRNSVAVLSGA